MRYKTIQITNYKGILNASISLIPSGANIFTLIGLNESGKTTVLEAISKFGIDDEQTELLYSVSGITGDRESYIPKEKKANFTGQISIALTAIFSPGEKEEIIKSVELEHGVSIDRSSMKDEVIYTRIYKYEDSKFKTMSNTINIYPFMKEGRKKNYIEVSSEHRAWQGLAKTIRSSIPKIVYYPTFLFSFPERIWLNPVGKEDPVNAIYRRVIGDVAGALPNKLDVDRHIVDRIISDTGASANAFASSARQLEVAQALEQMSFHISQTVFTEWKKVLGGSYQKREIVLRPIVENQSDEKPKVYLQFALREGGSIFDLSERSMGFRWFFSFLLFTLYRSKANIRGSTIFLLDEPASNLHPRAQMQLLDSFSEIANRQSAIIYSTHSHYMINPAWLEQAYVVSNTAIEEAEEQEQGQITQNPTRVSVKPYRMFVGENPDKMNYFQAVLDKLEYSPSKLEFLSPSMLVEGKGDYIIIQYVKDVILDIRDGIGIIPTRGATAMGEIVGLLLGWGVTFCVCLDADREGKAAKVEYISEWGIPASRVSIYSDIDPTLDGVSIEGLLDTADVELIQRHYSIAGRPSKSQIRLYFSEMLARREKVDLSQKLRESVRQVVDWARGAVSV
jgi:predicted ATP-dependent endonuclease of OLD family